MLSISQRALDYLIATRRLPTRRIGGRVLVPVSELRKICADRPSRTDRGLKSARQLSGLPLVSLPSTPGV